MTKNNEEVFVLNPQPFFQIFVDRGQYIGYRNLEELLMYQTISSILYNLYLGQTQNHRSTSTIMEHQYID